MYSGSLLPFICWILQTVVCVCDEFGTYTVTELFSESDCSGLIRLSPDSGWKFGGQVLYDPAHGMNCESFELYISAEYQLSYNILFYLEDFNENETSIDEGVFFKAYSLESNATDIICNGCLVNGMPYSSAQDSLTLRFGNQTRSWTLTFTLFRESQFCYSYEYMCSGRRCIFHSLNCNGHNPCGDHSDCRVTYAAMAAIGFGGFCALGVLFLLMYILVKSRKMSIWSSREKQPRKFSPAKALQSIPSFTPAIIAVTPLQRRWSYKY